MNDTDSVAPGTANAPAKNGGKFAGATLFVLAVTATFAPQIAAATLGIEPEWSGGLSTGGLVALIASIVMWAKCRTWEAWWKWIWLPVGITVILAFVVVNLSVADALDPQVEPAAAPATAEQVCADLEAQLEGADQRAQDLENEAGEYAGFPTMSDGNTMWVPVGPGPDRWSGLRAENHAWAQAYYDQRGGAELQSQVDQLSAEFEASC